MIWTLKITLIGFSMMSPLNISLPLPDLQACMNTAAGAVILVDWLTIVDDERVFQATCIGRRRRSEDPTVFNYPNLNQLPPAVYEPPNQSRVSP